MGSHEERVPNEQLINITRCIGDRFETGLLWKQPNPFLPNIYNMCLKCCLSLGIKFKKIDIGDDI